MTRQVLYVAHCLAPREEDIHSHPAWREHPAPEDCTREEISLSVLHANIQRALRWLSWLRRSFPETTFIAPWIAAVLSGEDDRDPAQREAGLVDDCAVVERCDGIVLCGPRISSGMQREMEHGQEHHTGGRFTVFNLTPSTGYAEPSQIPPDLTPSAGQTLFSWIHRMVGYRMAQECSP